MKRANSPIMVIDEGFRPGQMELPDFDDFRNSYDKKHNEYDEMADGNVSDDFYDSDEGSENFQKEIHHEGHEHRHSMNSNPKRGIFKKIYRNLVYFHRIFDSLLSFKPQESQISQRHD